MVNLFNWRQSTHNLKFPSFFLTNKIGTSKGDTLGQMNCFSNNISNCFFSSTNSKGDILHGVIEIGPILSIKSIENFSVVWQTNNVIGKTLGKF